MTQLALSWEPFELRTTFALETFVERVPVDSFLSAHIDRWKAMRRDGWDVTALLAPDSRSVVCLACRGEA